jgi:flagellar hook-length control protein FliK
MRPSQQPEIPEADPGTELKPIADRAPPATAKHDEDNQSADSDNASLPIETPALQTSGNSDATPSHQPTSPQPQPIAAQLAGRLAPAINQAQAILRILENAGDAGPVVKTLQFALRPRDLGEMRVTLSLGTGELSLRIETQTEEAARRLELDRSLLDTMLTQAGVAVDRSQIDIRVNRFDPQQPAASFEGAGPRGGETPASFSHDHSQRQSRPGSPHQASEGHQNASSTTVVSDRRDRRSIYL